MEKIITGLTQNQKRFYEAQKTYINKNGRSPTVSEMVRLMEFSSPRSVTQYLESLEAKGLIRRWRYKNRGIELVNKNSSPSGETLTIPVIASAGCDQISIFAETFFGEYICVQKELLAGKQKEKIVSIRAIGASMDEAGVHDGDYVLVEVTEDIHDNDLVVAIIDNFAVIKKITLANNAVILNPVSSDPSYKPIILRRDFKLFGIVVDVIRAPQKGELEVVPIYETPEINWKYLQIDKNNKRDQALLKKLELVAVSSGNEVNKGINFSWRICLKIKSVLSNRFYQIF